MPGTDESAARKLAELRDKIDAIDAEMHRLLIARGSVIDTLIKVKGTSRPGAAFRPGREAEMMRRLVARHEGALPLATVEHIWREIITTFTRMQAGFDVGVDLSVEPERMRDLARFTFGFSVKLLAFADPAAVVAHVARGNDLGLIARDQPKEAGAWWRGLTGAASPRIMALLPFIKAAGGPADLPAFVVSPQLSDPSPADLEIHAVRVSGRWREVAGGMRLAGAEEGDATEVLLAVPGPSGEQAVAERAKAAGMLVESVQAVGGAARGIAVDGTASMLYQRLDLKGAADEPRA